MRSSRERTDTDITRRELFRFSTKGAAVLGTALALPEWATGAMGNNQASPLNGQSSNGQSMTNPNLYSDLLMAWCDGLTDHQVTSIHDLTLYGGILCPACALIHGRCADAVYPLLWAARQSNYSKYVRAAVLAQQWSEQVSRSDGSWVNDVNLSAWKGITVFRAIALAEALEHHGSLLDTKTRQRWTDRLARAARFLDSFITIGAGNINYPATSSYCYALVGRVLNDSHYLDQAQKRAHEVLQYFTSNGLLFGEGHPQTGVTAKKCRAVDMGYNVEESLPALAMYALAMDDKQVLEQVIAALRAHLEFMLPDGAWDNSWGTRNYKWTWWGSRTSDGCHTAYALLAQYDPKFREAAWRNLGLMASCTQNGLLHGGPHYFAHGDLPCIHHTFTHSKALATVLEHGGAEPPVPRLSLPREEAYGVKSYAEIGTHLVANGDWLATITEYDWDYSGHALVGGTLGGHASGGAMSLLFHRQLGPVLTASMTEYQLIEVSNQQVHRDSPHMSLTPRIECAAEKTYTSQNDFEATVTKKAITAEEVTIEARGRLLTSAREPISGGDVYYQFVYSFHENGVEISASADKAGPAPLRLILPVVSQHEEPVEKLDSKNLQITKPNGKLLVRTDAADGFEPLAKERTFNLVPGFECVPVTVTMQPGQVVRVELSASEG
jgi:hypothetical protein